MQPEQVKQLIQSQLPDAEVFVDSADGVHFEAIVVSAAFESQSRVQQQQSVYAALDQHIQDGTLHAIALKTYTPEKWQQRQSQG